MIEGRDLEKLERQAYHRSTADGVIDLFVGGMLASIGATWIWLPDYAGLAGILPAVLVPVMVEVRKRIADSRGGYVRWSQSRRSWENRNVGVLIVACVMLFLAGIAAFVVFDGTSADGDLVDSVMPGLLAWLLALTAVVFAFFTATRRLLVYAVVLAIAGLLTAWAEASPGWPLLVAGIVIGAIGAVMSARFISSNPIIDTP